MWHARLDEAQAEIKIAEEKKKKIAERNRNNFRYTDNTTFMVESEEELYPFDESERGEWKKLA